MLNNAERLAKAWDVLMRANGGHLGNWVTQVQGEAGCKTLRTTQMRGCTSDACSGGPRSECPGSTLFQTDRRDYTLRQSLTGSTSRYRTGNANERIVLCRRNILHGRSDDQRESDAGSRHDQKVCHLASHFTIMASHVNVLLCNKRCVLP
jgi:hypothetical protein